MAVVKGNSALKGANWWMAENLVDLTLTSPPPNSSPYQIGDFAEVKNAPNAYNVYVYTGVGPTGWELWGQKGGSGGCPGPIAISVFAAIHLNPGENILDRLGRDTIGAKSGFVRWVTNVGSILTDRDVSGTLCSGQFDVSAPELANAVGYTLFVYDGLHYTGNSQSQNAKP